METQHFSYDNKITKQFAYATMLWGVVGLLAGLFIAAQMAFPALNFELAFTTFGRTRPVHTNAIIFAFVGNGIFTAVYYSLQRLCKARMFSDVLSQINFWGWQSIIVIGAVTLLAGFTTGKEYAELEWPVDILITIIWVVFGWNMFGTILKRRTSHLYVAIWFYIATFVTVAVLHLVNSFEVPYSFVQSYPVYAGVQDALVQWWYGHNAVAFFLTTPYLGLMYYFLPKAANRPVYSYRLSIIHFWALIFIYIWSGPHHLLYTALPNWAQSLGVIFSVMLIAPSWGGMVNGLLTLKGVWDKVRTSPDLKFFAVAITAYGMATFEGPMLALKNVNAFTHYSDWTVAHTHIGGLGWNGFLTFGMLYWLIPRLFNTKLYSEKLGNVHFWLGTLGIIVYAVPLYAAGIVQTLMLREFTPDGFLKYPNFLETMVQIKPMYHARVLSGILYIAGFVIMLVNMAKTIKQGTFVANEEASAPALEQMNPKKDEKESWHRWLERRPIQLLVASLIAILIGSVIELIPGQLIENNTKSISSIEPYTPLELEGRDIYIREGCNTCHSQMIRPFRWETERFGEYSKAGEFVYDHPHVWGSRRTGPDLARTGDKNGPMYKTADWHYVHMENPQKMNPQSMMPPYPWLVNNSLDTDNLASKISAMRTVGVPYPKGYEDEALADLQEQAEGIAADLKKANINCSPDKEIVALIAYLHKLGKDISKIEPEQAEKPAHH